MSTCSAPNTFRYRHHLLAAGLAVALLGGCASVGPDYATPGTPTPERWREGNSILFSERTGDLVHWWQRFDDPLLNRLAEDAAANNRNLRQALAAVTQARARLGADQALFWPSVDADGAASRTRPSENGVPAGDGTPYNSLSLGASLSWEIDLFGRVARMVEADQASLEAAYYYADDVRVSLLGEVASRYFDIRASQARLAAAEANIASQKEMLRITEARFRAGLASSLDVAQAEQVLAGSEATLPPLRAQIAVDINTLGVLCGHPPGYLAGQLGVSRPLPEPVADIAVGIPADLLRRRPDVRQAERDLAAAVAGIGVAEAALYPSLSLSGTLGLLSGSGASLFRSASQSWSGGGALGWNIFDAGRLRAQVAEQEASAEQSRLAYEQTVLNALSEVENALVSYARGLDSVHSQQRAVDASRRYLDLSFNLYKQGLTDFQSVLDAQRQLFASEDSLATARGETVGQLVTLYRALGGGWDPASVDTARLAADVAPPPDAPKTAAPPPPGA